MLTSQICFTVYSHISNNMLQGTIHCINVIFRPTFKVLKKSNTFQDIETDYISVRLCSPVDRATFSTEWKSALTHCFQSTQKTYWLNLAGIEENHLTEHFAMFCTYYTHTWTP